MFDTARSNGAQAIPLAERLPMAYFCAPGIAALKFGGFARSLRFRGGDADSMSEEELDAAMRLLHDALRRVRGKLSVLIEGRRVPAPLIPTRTCPMPGAARSGRIPYPSSTTRSAGTPTTGPARGIFVRSRHRPGVAASQELRNFIQASDMIKGMLDGVMKECAWLDDAETFDYYHKTVSTHRHRVKPSYGKARIDHDIADCRLVGGVDPILGDCRFRTITVKNAPDTLPAAMAGLDALPFEPMPGPTSRP